MEELLERIKIRAQNPGTIHDMAEGLSPVPVVNPILSLEILRKAEAELGFQFPELFVGIYTGIGNGGFGPGYGLYTFEHAKELYLELTGNADNEWEKGTWPLCTWGCGIDSYVDCEDHGAVYYTNSANAGDHNPISFTLTDADGNVITSGNAGNLLDALNKVENGGGARPGGEEGDDDDHDEPGLLYHKDTLEDWFTDWVNGVDLWNEIDGGEGEEEGDDEQDDHITPPDDSGRGR
jgi:hypothetical protein